MFQKRSWREEPHHHKHHPYEKSFTTDEPKHQHGHNQRLKTTTTSRTNDSSSSSNSIKDKPHPTHKTCCWPSLMTGSGVGLPLSFWRGITLQSGATAVAAAATLFIVVISLYHPSSLPCCYIHGAPPSLSLPHARPSSPHASPLFSVDTIYFDLYRCSVSRRSIRRRSMIRHRSTIHRCSMIHHLSTIHHRSTIHHDSPSLDSPSLDLPSLNSPSLDNSPSLTITLLFLHSVSSLGFVTRFYCSVPFFYCSTLVRCSVSVFVTLFRFSLLRFIAWLWFVAPLFVARFWSSVFVARLWFVARSRFSSLGFGWSPHFLSLLFSFCRVVLSLGIIALFHCSVLSLGFVARFCRLATRKTFVVLQQLCSCGMFAFGKNKE
jgi:hypothetical protein